MEAKITWVEDRVGEWDAINHIIGWGKTYADLMGGYEIYADVIKQGRQLAPVTEMWVNEGQILAGSARRKPYREVIEFLIENEAAPDGIGFMGHFRDGSLTPPEEIYSVLDAYADLGLKLQITELDVDCGNDEELQADYLRDVMIVSFSHPSMEAVVLWGFWEGQHWRPPAGLWRKDRSAKPAGEAWLDLVFNKWWTKEKGVTDTQGTFETRGFLGEYQITVRKNENLAEVCVALTKEGTNVTVTLD
jgi:GH35 family endo-1,4-beta-xylanase